VGLFDSAAGTAEDTDFPCRLALAGCNFAGIDRALNYRRYHSGRGRKDLPGRINDVKRVQAGIFSDPRCPDDVREMGQMAIKHHLTVIVSLALIQNETELAQKYVRELVELDPSVIKGKPCELVEFLLSECIADDSVDLEILLKQVFSQFPQDLAWLSSHYDPSVARGYLWKGIRAIIWGREKDGYSYFARAVDLHANMDENLIQHTTYHLLGYENEFGSDAVMRILSNLIPYINQVTKHSGNRLESSYLINRAFVKYQAKNYKEIPIMIFRAWKSNPPDFTNRGVISIFLRSLFRMV